MEVELLKCSACRTVLADSGECRCDFNSDVDVALYRHNLIQVIKGCISKGAPNQSEIALTDLPFHVRVEGRIIKEICLYPNCIQIFVNSLCYKYTINATSNPIESERAEGGSTSRQSYTLPVRLMYISEDIVMQASCYPDAIIQIPGRGLNWQQILEDVESNRAELQWREINLFTHIHGSEDFQLTDFIDWWLHVQGTGDVIDYNDPSEDSDDVDAPPPAARSAVENLERERIEESRDFMCCICQATLLAGEISVKMPCTHEFHEHCILQWLAVSNSCPTCKFELPTDDPDYEEEKQGRNN